ncbi:MAG: lipid-A-disaccharide synthase [Candidatus Binatota bacterium]|nr:lipid-A-disaccharide synthase [Candidatus Binatota bacterium]
MPEVAESSPAAARVPRVLLVAGEASGDLHAADLVRELRKLFPAIAVGGIGGAEARTQGMETFVDIAEIATFGLTEVAEKARALVRAYRRVARELRERRPDLLVLIDYPEFNLALAGRARRLGVPVFYYVSPQVWAWRKGRVRKILRRVDRLAAVFPFEPEVYGHSEKVTFVGHPLLDRVRATATREDTCRRHGLDPARRLVTLLPGSRRREIEVLLPEMAAACELLGPGRDLQFAVALAPTLPRSLAASLASAARVAIPVVENDTYNLIRAADLVLATSGTATLETALLERPMVIAYRVSPLTFFAARLLVDVPAIGMPNLIGGRRIVPELLQGEARAARIAEEAAAILDDPARARQMSADLARVRDSLGSGGAAARAAGLAAEYLR